MKRKHLKYYVLGLMFILSAMIITFSIGYANNKNKGNSKIEETAFQTTNLQVTVSNSADSTPIRATSSENYGNLIQVSAPIKSGYTFLYWVDTSMNNKVLSYQNDLSFYVTRNNMIIQAVYQDNNSFSIRFVDYNGYVIPGGDKVAVGDFWNITPPDRNILIKRPGHEFKFWSLDGVTQASMENVSITSDLVYHAVYGLQSGLSTFKVTITSQDDIENIPFGTVVTVTANTTPANKVFSHWVEGARILSYDEVFSFTVYRNITIEAIYTELAPSSTAIVTLDNYRFKDSYGESKFQTTVMGRVEIPIGSQLIETGVIFYRGNVSNLIEINTEDAIIVSSNNQSIYGEFSLTDIDIPNNTPVYARTYARYMTEETLSDFIYSSNMLPINVYATDLFISEYIEGASFNKAIELYNGTGTSVNLKNYTLELYSNGSSTVTNSMKVSDIDYILGHGESVVLCHASAAIDIIGRCDFQNSSVINHNGDDAFVLKNNGVIIDSFGQVGFDPGTSWNSGGVKTHDQTLVRKPFDINGRTNHQNVFDPSLYFIQYPIATHNMLGEHFTYIDNFPKQ